MDSTTLLIIAVVLLSDLIVIFVISRANKARRLKVQQRIAAEAEAEGWKSRPVVNPKGLCHLEGTMAAGITWELLVERSGNLVNNTRKPKSQNTLWRTKDVRLEGNVLAIGPGGGLRLSVTDIDLGNSMIQTALKRIHGDDLAPLLAPAHIVELPEGTLPRIYMMMSDNPDLAAQFLREPVPSLLRDWQSEKMPMPSVMIWSGGMQVRFLKGSDDTETLRKIVMLCGALALRGKEIAEQGRGEELTFTA